MTAVRLLDSIFSMWFLLTLPIGVLAIVLGVAAYRWDGLASIGIVSGILALFFFIGTF